MNDPHDDPYDSVPLRPVGQITGPIVLIRDEATFAFSEPFPLPMAFPVTQPFDTPQQQLVDRLVVAQRRGDHATFAETLDKLCELRDVQNGSSGNVAPIDLTGQG